MNAAAALGRAGVPLDLIGLWGTGSGEEPQQEVEREIERNPLIRVMSPRHVRHRRNRWLSLPMIIGSLIRRGGIRVFAKVAARAARRGGTQFLSIAEVFARTDADVLHCQFATVAPIALEMRELGVLRSAIVVHFRGYDISQYVQEHGERVYDDVFVMADWFIANCEAFRQRCIELGCDERRIEVISSGTDTHRFALAEREPPKDGSIRLLAVGRLVEKKGFGLAIGAVAKLRERGVDATLDIIGDGELRDELERQIADAGLRKQVRLHGALPHGEIVDWLARTDALVAPSITATRGDADAPVNTIKEAMATGMPVIGSRHGGIPEIVEPGVNGLLCEENDADDLASKIENLLGLRDRWRDMGLAGRATVERGHSLDLSNRQYLQVYERVTGKRREPV